MECDERSVPIIICVRNTQSVCINNLSPDHAIQTVSYTPEYGAHLGDVELAVDSIGKSYVEWRKNSLKCIGSMDMRIHGKIYYCTVLITTPSLITIVIITSSLIIKNNDSNNNI